MKNWKRQFLEFYIDFLILFLVLYLPNPELRGGLLFIPVFVVLVICNAVMIGGKQLWKLWQKRMPKMGGE